MSAGAAVPVPTGGPVVCLTPNPAWDVTYGVDRVLPGETLRVRDVRGRAGGKGVNVARVARALGASSVAVAPAGGPLAAVFAADLAAAGQPAVLVPVAGALRQSVAVVPERAGPDDGGHPTVLNEPGPELTAPEWAALVAATRRAADEVAADEAAARAAARPAAGSAPPSTRGRPVVVTVSGSLPPGTDAERLAALVATLHDGGHRVLVDVSGPGLLWAAAAGADLLKPNRGELAEATGCADVGEGVRELRRRGARDVVVTDGEAGLAVYPAARPPGPGIPPAPVARARLDAVLSGNPTGAGDAAMAALAVGAGLDWPDRLGLAVATSAAAVLQPVAGAVDPDDVVRLAGRTLTQH